MVAHKKTEWENFMSKGLKRCVHNGVWTDSWADGQIIFPYTLWHTKWEKFWLLPKRHIEKGSNVSLTFHSKSCCNFFSTCSPHKYIHIWSKTWSLLEHKSFGLTAEVSLIIVLRLHPCQSLKFEYLQYWTSLRTQVNIF